MQQKNIFFKSPGEGCCAIYRYEYYKDKENGYDDRTAIGEAIRIAAGDNSQIRHLSDKISVASYSGIILPDGIRVMRRLNSLKEIDISQFENLKFFEINNDNNDNNDDQRDYLIFYAESEEPLRKLSIEFEKWPHMWEKFTRDNGCWLMIAEDALDCNFASYDDITPEALSLWK